MIVAGKSRVEERSWDLRQWHHDSFPCPCCPWTPTGAQFLMTNNYSLHRKKFILSKSNVFSDSGSQAVKFFSFCEKQLLEKNNAKLLALLHHNLVLG